MGLNKLLIINGHQPLACTMATAAQAERHYANAGQMWAGPLSLQQYLSLQRHLISCGYDDYDPQHWVLFNPEYPSIIVSGCSVYLRDAIMNKGRGIESVKAAVISNIFTHVEFRRKGMAKRLLTAVRRSLDNMEGKRIEFSVIYSGVNNRLYQQLGWNPQPATQLRLCLGNAQIPEPQHCHLVTKIGPHNFGILCENSINISKLRLSRLRDEQGSFFAQMLATRHVFLQHTVRSLALRNILAPPEARDRSPTIGVIFNGGGGKKAWALWVPDFQTRKLFIAQIFTTRLADMQEAYAQLIHEAVVEASGYGMREVVMWEATPDIVAGVELLAKRLGGPVQAIFEERSDMIPCIRLQEQNTQELKLLDGQFYAWR